MLDLNMLKEISSEMDIPLDEIEQFYDDLFPTPLHLTSHVVVSTGFSKTSEHPDWLEKQQFEKEFIIHYINLHFGPCPEGTRLKWMKNKHDFGLYCDMAYSYDQDEPEHIAYLDELQSINSESLELAIIDAWKTAKCKVIEINNSKKTG